MYKYRNKFHLKLNLLLGIQTNHHWLNTSLNVNSALKIIVKKFQLPSMKKILLEVVYRTLTMNETCFDFGTHFLRTLTEHIKFFGLSLEKFSRMFNYMIVDFALNKNKLFSLVNLEGLVKEKAPDNDKLLEFYEGEDFQSLVTEHVSEKFR